MILGRKGACGYRDSSVQRKPSGRARGAGVVYVMYSCGSPYTTEKCMVPRTGIRHAKTRSYALATGSWVLYALRGGCGGGHVVQHVSAGDFNYLVISIINGASPRVSGQAASMVVSGDSVDPLTASCMEHHRYTGVFFWLHALTPRVTPLHQVRRWISSI
jgi:hypothetical protein